MLCETEARYERRDPDFVENYSDGLGELEKGHNRREGVTMGESHHDVVIVGAGVIGSIAARELAPDHDVLVVDRTGVAAEATGLSAGLVSPTLFYGDIPDAARHANEFFREFDGTHQFSFTERERLDLVRGDRLEAARETVDQLTAEGFPVSYLSADEAEQRHPSFDVSRFDGAVLYGDTGWVDPYSYATALKEDAEAHGARFETGVTVTDVLDERGEVTGVETDDGVRGADHVVVAAGWRTDELLGDDLDLPARPYRTQVVVLELDDGLPDDFPLVRVGSQELYMRPEHNGDLLVGGSHHTLDEPRGASRNADEEFQMQVADVVPTFLNGFDRAGIVNDWAGVDTGTSDGRPIVDTPEQGPDGLVVATGFNGLGVTISPVAGALVRGLVTDESPPFPVDPFRLNRFESADGTFDIHYTSEI